MWGEFCWAVNSFSRSNSLFFFLPKVATEPFATGMSDKFCDFLSDAIRVELSHDSPSELLTDGLCRAEVYCLLFRDFLVELTSDAAELSNADSRDFVDDPSFSNLVISAVGVSNREVI